MQTCSWAILWPTRLSFAAPCSSPPCFVLPVYVNSTFFDPLVTRCPPPRDSGDDDADRYLTPSRIARLLEHRRRHGRPELCLLRRGPAAARGGVHRQPAVPIRDPEHRRDAAAQPGRDLPRPQRAGAEIPGRGHRAGTPERAAGRREESLGPELAGRPRRLCKGRVAHGMGDIL